MYDRHLSGCNTKRETTFIFCLHWFFSSRVRHCCMLASKRKNISKICLAPNHRNHFPCRLTEHLSASFTKKQSSPQLLSAGLWERLSGRTFTIISAYLRERESSKWCVVFTCCHAPWNSVLMLDTTPYFGSGSQHNGLFFFLQFNPLPQRGALVLLWFAFFVCIGDHTHCGTFAKHITTHSQVNMHNGCLVVTEGQRVTEEATSPHPFLPASVISVTVWFLHKRSNYSELFNHPHIYWA